MSKKKTAEPSATTSDTTESTASDAPIGDVESMPETASTVGLIDTSPPVQPTKTTEDMIAAAGLTGRRVKPEDLEAEIAQELFFTAADGARNQGIDAYFPSSSPIHRLTFCVLVLKNGSTAVGQSSCVSPENFNADIGRKIARENAVSQLWPLLGFRLADRIHQNLP